MFAVFLASCKSSNHTVVSRESPGTVISNSQAKAYFSVFEALYKKDTGLNNGKYLALDLTKAKLTDKTQLIKLMHDFCNSHGYTLLQDTFEELKEKGYIKNLSFNDGFLITFNDKELTQKKLITSAKKWCSGLGAIGAEYTVEKKNDIWQITKGTNFWIS